MNDGKSNASRVVELDGLGKFTPGRWFSRYELFGWFNRELINLQELQDSGGDARAIANADRRNSLAALGLSDVIKNYLLDTGRYLAGERLDGIDGYRVPTKTETAAYVIKYFEAAERKYSRGRRLNRSLPVVPLVNELQERIAVDTLSSISAESQRIMNSQRSL